VLGDAFPAEEAAAFRAPGCGLAVGVVETAFFGNVGHARLSKSGAG
jgi:hypothetical protein